jgi:hypothetical protein
MMNHRAGGGTKNSRIMMLIPVIDRQRLTDLDGDEVAVSMAPDWF